MRRLVGVLAIIAGTLAFPVGAAAQQQDGCSGVQIQPARMDVDHVNRYRETIVVSNCEDVALEVTLTLTGLGHDLDGTPRFIEDDALAEYVTMYGLGSVTLPPGGTHAVRMSSRIPGGERSIYVGLVAEFRRLGQAAGSSVDTRSRVAAMLLQRGPEPWNQRAKVIDVATVPLGDGRYRVDAIVEATGDVHITPTARAQIVKGQTTVASIRLSSGTILPGFRRRLSGVWEPGRLPSGDHGVTVTVSDPDATGFSAAQFAGGELQVPAARITNLSAVDDDGPFIAVDVENIGTVPLSPAVEIVIEQGEFERARTTIPVDEVAVDSNFTVEWNPALADGAYRVTARVLQDGEVLDETVTGLRVGAPPVPPARLPLLAFAGLLPVIIGLAMWWVAVRNRRSRDDEGPDGPASVTVGHLRRSKERIG